MVANNQQPLPRAQSVFICPSAEKNHVGTYFLPYSMNMNLSPWNLAVATRFGEVNLPSAVVAMAEAPGPYASTYPSKQAYGIIARHTQRINLLFLAGQVQSFPGPYVGCGVGDPGLAGVRWLTGTPSDASSGNY